MTVTPDVARLPDATYPHPTCGTCGSETVLECGTFFCYECDLTFDPDDLTATYRDPAAEACSHPCENTWHQPHAIKQGHGYDCQPCALPAGHESLHWTGCVARGEL